MKAYCKHCQKIVDVLDGWKYKKCSKCYQPIYPTMIERFKSMVAGGNNVQ